MRTPSDVERRPSVLMIAYTNYESDPRVIREAEAAAEGGFNVDFLALRRGNQPAAEMARGVRVLRVRQERYRGASRMRYLLSYMEFFLRCVVASTTLHLRNRYRVVHVNNMPDVLVWSVLIPRMLGAKVVLDIHDPMPETFGSKFVGARAGAFYRLLLFLERLSVAFAHKTITVSEPVKTGILVKHGYKPEAIGVVANFADEDVFQLQPYPAIDGKIRFVFHGTILERNGLRILIDALTMVRFRQRIAVRIVGEGDFSAELKSLIASHSLEDVVEFRHRAYPLREIPGILADCHVGLVPLLLSAVANYALPLKLVEYTCLGKPSISIRNAAIDHYLRPDEFLPFQAGSASSLAALMDKVVETPELLLAYREKQLGARARLSWQHEKSTYVAMLTELAGPVRRRERAVSPAGTSGTLR